MGRAAGRTRKKDHVFVIYWNLFRWIFWVSERAKSKNVVTRARVFQVIFGRWSDLFVVRSRSDLAGQASEWRRELVAGRTRTLERVLRVRVVSRWTARWPGSEAYFLTMLCKLLKV